MSEVQRCIVFHEDSCIQCHGCEMACRMWRNTEPGIRWRHVKNFWSGEYPEVTCKSLSLSCLHCAEPACTTACPAEAISKRDDDGIVLVDRNKCIGCRACAGACPYGIPQFGEDGLMQKCDLCAGTSGSPPCVATCPTHALELKEMTVEEKEASEKFTYELLNKMLF